MTVVRKANRIIRVTDNELARYLANGYEIIGDERKPVKADAPTPENTIERDTEITSTPVVEEKSATIKKRRNNK